MAYEELRRLSQDAQKNPDLIMEIVDRNDDIDDLIKHLNGRGYMIKKSEIDELEKQAPDFVKYSKAKAAGAPSPIIAIVAVVVAVFLWVV